MLNKALLIGRVATTIDLRYTPNGNATCKFSVACDRPMKNSQGEKEVDFINCVVPPYRGKLAELVAQFTDKGKLVAVEGSIQTRNYTNGEGQKIYITEVIANEVKFLSSKDSNTLGNETPAEPDFPF